MVSPLLNIRLPQVLFSAMEKHVRKRDFAVFARQALAEKLQRDFGEKIAAENFGWRAGQGRRTDLIARRDALRAVREAAENDFPAAADETELFKKIGIASSAGTAEMRTGLDEARLRAAGSAEIRAALNAWAAAAGRQPLDIPALEKAWLSLCAVVEKSRERG